MATQISRQGLKNPDPLRTEAMVDGYPEDTIGSYQLSHSISLLIDTGTRRHRPTIWPAIPGARPVLGRRVDECSTRVLRTETHGGMPQQRVGDHSPAENRSETRVEGLHRGAYLRNQMLGHGRLLPPFWICEVAVGRDEQCP